MDYAAVAALNFMLLVMATLGLRSLCRPRPRPLYTVQPNTWHKHSSRLRVYDSDILCVWLHWSFRM